MTIEEIKKSYIDNMNYNINLKRNNIIESFITYYGEEYRELITKRFNNITFVYYLTDINKYMIDNLLNYKGISKKDITYQKEAKDMLMKAIKDKYSNNIYLSDNDLDPTMLRHLNRIAVSKKNEYPNEFNIFDGKDIKRFVTIPIFYTSDIDLFSSINYAVCSEVIYNEKGQIIKRGLDYTYKNKTINHEIINELIAKDIYKIYRKNNKKIITYDSELVHTKPKEYSSDKLYNLLNNFYLENKKEIKLASIKEPTTYLEKENYKILTKKEQF